MFQENIEIKTWDELSGNKSYIEFDVQNEWKKLCKRDYPGELPENIDYKKMSINKLRSLILEKGLSTDTTKLKKPELIKLLGIE